MFIITVTGGLAAGKSLACEYFRDRGAVVIDLDDVAHRLLLPGTPLVSRIAERFGDDVLDGEGGVDRALLARRAFADEDSARALNEIMHPAIARDVMPGLTEMGLLQNPPPYVALDVPMLVEAPLFAEVADVVVAISAPEETRVRRAVERGMDEEDARARIACQATDEERAEMADAVIENTGTKEQFLSALERFWDEVVEVAT